MNLLNCGFRVVNGSPGLIALLESRVGQVLAPATLAEYLFPRICFAQFQSAMSLMAALGCMVVLPLMGAWLDATGNDYRHTFIACGALALAAALAFTMLHRHFQRLGGAVGYRAPE